MLDISVLNDKQAEAVQCTEGPLLVLAGAGTGKTRVLTHRVAYILENGLADPYEIMAITFTNKAAGEMRDRINSLVGYGAESIWVSTFHSACVRILRRYIDRIGYGTNFTIYDSGDQSTVVKNILAGKSKNDKINDSKKKFYITAISGLKNRLITLDDYKESDEYDEKVYTVYEEYEEELKKNNALDFDDLLLKTVMLLETDEEAREYYQNRLKYILVDEYQDTNKAQFELIRLLSGKYKNICVVGDDDQSIYKFRGADIRNILDFEKVFENTKVVKLEQNYRSTGNILDAANNVIKHNEKRKSKALWTEEEDGLDVEFHRVENEYNEADFVARTIKRLKSTGRFSFGDFACLYRTNAQSRHIEEAFVNNDIPYNIVGGKNFYQRREIKDIIAYLKTVNDGVDDLAVKRIINVPKRGIGEKTIQNIEMYADSNGINFYDALADKNCMDILGTRTAKKVERFVYEIESIRTLVGVESLSNVISRIIEDTGYEEMINEGTKEDAMNRMENLGALISKAIEYEEDYREKLENRANGAYDITDVSNMKPKDAESEDDEAVLGTGRDLLTKFLADITLMSDIDNLEEDDSRVLMMTVHASKGLEFDNVFLCGMEENTFPNRMVLNEKDGVEEERRLCYVAMTRARKRLYLLSAKHRMIRGSMYLLNVSRFIREIPGLYKENAKEIQYRERMENNDEFQDARHEFKRKAVFNISVEKIDSLDYGVGDTVRHMKFGVGEVKEIRNGGRDYEVTVDFENYGVKKMFASFAKLQKLD